jgi:hypothetical protein
MMAPLSNASSAGTVVVMRRMRTMSETTPARDMTPEAMRAELLALDVRWESLRDGLDESGGMGGSPGEWLVERMWELEAELKRRGLAIPEPSDG